MVNSMKESGFRIRYMGLENLGIVRERPMRVSLKTIKNKVTALVSLSTEITIMDSGVVIKGRAMAIIYGKTKINTKANG